MSAVEFWIIQPCEFYAINHKYLEQLKFKDQNEWERIRWQTTWLVNCHVTKPLKAQDLIKFDWETEDESSGLTKQKIEELKKKWNLDNG
jgi:hypothetical protein